MAEATDRSRAAGERTSPDLGTMPAEAIESYRPLSLLALAGFGVAALYAAIVVIGGAIALINRLPYLMPLWTFLIPVAAVCLASLARRRIRASENTLSGMGFTTWSFGLAVVVALNYAFYYGATFWAVRQQAVGCADRFFDHIKKDRLELAFLNQNVGEEEEARDAVEIKFNSPLGRQMKPGYFAQFRQSEYVRAIQRGGDQTRVEPRGVMEWAHESGGYKVVLRYHVAAPVAEFDMFVTAFGSDSKPGEPKGRHWVIDVKTQETRTIPGTLTMTAEGEKMLEAVRRAQRAAQTWQEDVQAKRWDEAYLDTLAPSERKRQRVGEQASRCLRAAPIGGVATVGLYTAACQDFLAGREAFLDGQSSFRIDDKEFWTSRAQRQAIVKRVRQTFRSASGGNSGFKLNVLYSDIPQSRDGGTTLLFDVQLVYLDPMANLPDGNAMPQYLVDGQLAVTAVTEDATAAKQEWRVNGIELKKWSAGRTAPAMTEQNRPSGGSGGSGGAVLPGSPQGQ